MTMPNKDVWSFPSAEHAFHCLKFFSTGYIEVAKKFKIGINESGELIKPDVGWLGTEAHKHRLIHELSKNELGFWMASLPRYRKQILIAKFTSTSELIYALCSTQNKELWYKNQRWIQLEIIRNKFFETQKLIKSGYLYTKILKSNNIIDLWN